MRPYSYNGHRIEQAPDRLHRCMKCCGAIGLDFHVDDKCTDAFLDLSPLQKFMGRRIPLKNMTSKPVTVGCVTVAPNTEAMVSAEDYCRRYSISGPDSIVNAQIWATPDAEMRPNRMYGMDYDFDWVPTAPSPEPEKSPQEKILDEFIRKREAKRTAPAPADTGDIAEMIRREGEEWRRAKALERAMSILAPHEQDIHTRLMPYRREE